MSLSKADTDILLTYHSNAEISANIKLTASNEPVFKCESCSAGFDTNSKLQAHRYRKRNLRNPYRQLVTTATCPLCGQTYKSIRNCPDHITKVCGPRAKPQTIVLLTCQLREATIPDRDAQNTTTSTPPGLQQAITPNIQVLLSRTATRLKL